MSVALDRSPHDAETAFLERIRSDYESRGYSFITHPPRSVLPEFLASYRPDAVAAKDGQYIAIEVKSHANPYSEFTVERLRKLFEGHSDWQLSVIYMGRYPADVREMPILNKDAILRSADDAERLAEEGHEAAAFVLAWSLLEATLNNLHPDADKRPRTPGTVVQTLSMNGDISYESEKSLRPLIDLRNRVVHGDLRATPSVDDVRQVLMALRTALAEPATDAVS